MCVGSAKHFVAPCEMLDRGEPTLNNYAIAYEIDKVIPRHSKTRVNANRLYRYEKVGFRVGVSLSSGSKFQFIERGLEITAWSHLRSLSELFIDDLGRSGSDNLAS
jgi:hypothetical protein